MSIRRAESGFTLIELIVAIVIISIGVVGVLAAYISSVKGSADAVVGKQLVSIAEEMMEEVLLKPHAVNGGAPANALTACGPGASRAAFDDIRDYNGYQTTGICDIDGGAVSGLSGYGVAVQVQTVNLGGIANTLRVTVTASRGTQNLVLDGFRTAY